MLKRKIIVSYSLIALLIGFLIVTLIIFLKLVLLKESIQISTIYNLLENDPVFIVLLFIPLVLAAYAYYIGFYHQKRLNEYNLNYQTEIEKSKKVFDFIEKLREGKTDVTFTITDEYDKLGTSLINLRNELVRSKDEEDTRKREDEQRHWITEGLAIFGDILRENINNLNNLSNEITSNIVKYINAQQAGFFILNEKDDGTPFFQMTASFAYGRKKFPDKEIMWGEGLVGACALERKTITITEVTETYVEITSGLGKANPRSLLLVPLKINDEIHGVLELASFVVYQPYQIEFIEKVAESIASTISNVKINLRTAKLLEESQQQAELMARQEEEMRKNMSELRQTQIEAAKQSEQFISFTNSVNHTMIRAEYTVDGYLNYANTKFLEKMGYKSSSELNGKHISMFISEKDRPWFNKLWDSLAVGGRHFEGDMKHVTKQGTEVWTMATYVSVRDIDKNPQKILFLGIDITDSKKQSLDYKGQIDALIRSTLKAEYNSEGAIIEFNSRFLDLLGYNQIELKSKSIFDFILPDEIDEFQIIWQNIINGVPFEGRQKRFAKTGEEKWLQGTYTVVHDMYGEPLKIVYIGADITEQIRIEYKNKEQTETLKEQEQKLQLAKIELSKKLKETREEMKMQFREIETVKMLNEKILEGTLDAVISINENNQIFFFNKASEDLWGYKREEVIDRKISVILPDITDNSAEQNYLGSFFKAYNQALIGKRTEVFLIDKFENKITVLVTLSEAQIGDRYNLTAFIQRIELELF